jgi:hypothetical protein
MGKQAAFSVPHDIREDVTLRGESTGQRARGELRAVRIHGLARVLLQMSVRVIAGTPAPRPEGIRMDSSLIDVELTPRRLMELIRWHGTDESDLPAPHTLQNLSRDTVAALRELQRYRESMEQLRAAMGQAFWATDLRELHAILLEALGPPPQETVCEETGEWLIERSRADADAGAIRAPQ